MGKVASSCPETFALLSCQLKNLLNMSPGDEWGGGGGGTEGMFSPKSGMIGRRKF